MKFEYKVKLKYKAKGLDDKATERRIVSELMNLHRTLDRDGGFVVEGIILEKTKARIQRLS